MPMILILIVIVIGGMLLIKKTMPPNPDQSEKIMSVSDLDKAADELDTVDIDGLGNELPQTSADAATF